jgi:uncharacterized protein
MLGTDPILLLLASAITLVAGTVKGAVGFAMPMIMISALASFLPADQALAALILPTLATNLAQATRQGWRAAWTSIVEYRRLLVSLCLVIAVSAQLVPYVPQAALLMALGVPIVIFAVTQLLGWQARFHPSNRARAEITAGVVGGIFGGISGIWGPPTIALLLSLDVDRRENLRVQGVVYLIGAVILTAAHLASGVLNEKTLPLSLALTVPSMIGLWIGFAIHDRLDQQRFRRWTLMVLVITGLNLVRRALTL